MPVRVRDAVLSDVEVISNLYAEATAEGHFLPLNVSNQTFFQNCIETKRLTLGSSLGPYTTAVSVKVAIVDDEVVAFSTGKGFMHPRAVNRMGTEAIGRELWMIAVSSQQRRKGIGKTLLRNQFQTMLNRNNGDRGVYARCLLRSTTAMKMLESMGFKKTGEAPGENLYKFTPR